MDKVKCECHDLKLPRWDIMYCPYCKRKLAGYEIEYPKEKSFLQKIKEFFIKELPCQK